MIEYFKKNGICKTFARIFWKTVFIIQVQFGYIKTRKDYTYYLRGNGVEVGALHGGMALDQSIAKVKYIDILPLKELIARYPELHGLKLQAPDYIGSLESLDGIDANSQDFFIANHVLEHLGNPVRGLQEIWRVLKSDGIVFLTLPHKTRTFDEHRFITPVDHIIQDYENPSKSMDFIHFLEYANIEIPDDYTSQLDRAKELEEANFPIHFHTFVLENALGLIDAGNKAGYFHFDIIDTKDVAQNPCDHEFILILKKTHV